MIVIAIVIVVVGSCSSCSYYSVLVIGLVDFLSLFVSGVGTSRASILSTLSTTMSCDKTIVVHVACSGVWHGCVSSIVVVVAAAAAAADPDCHGWELL